MSVSREFLERGAADTGFPAAGLEKVVRLGELAGNVGRHPVLGEKLVLKGGTALNLGFGPPGRLSVDLDFNYVGAVERELMLVERPQIERAVTELARRSGYRVQQSANAFGGRKLFLHYRSVLGPEERIEVDLNFLLRLPLAEPEMRELWQPGDLDRPRLRFVAVEELLIGKLCALLDRCAARDAWDVANLAAEVAAVVEGPEFRGRFLILAATLDHAPDSYRESRLVERVTQQRVDEQLMPMLVTGVAPRATDLVTLAWKRVAPLLVLSDMERGFIEGLDAGELRTELLFPVNPDEAERLARHPALLWKAKHALEQHRRLGESGAKG